MMLGTVWAGVWRIVAFELSGQYRAGAFYAASQNGETPARIILDLGWRDLAARLNSPAGAGEVYPFLTQPISGPN